MSSADKLGDTVVEGEAGAHTSSLTQSGQDRFKHDHVQAPPSIQSTEVVTLGGKVFNDSTELWNYTKVKID
jgi:hypothetical protein